MPSVRPREGRLTEVCACVLSQLGAPVCNTVKHSAPPPNLALPRGCCPEMGRADNLISDSDSEHRHGGLGRALEDHLPLSEAGGPEPSRAMVSNDVA